MSQYVESLCSDIEASVILLVFAVCSRSAAGFEQLVPFESIKPIGWVRGGGLIRSRYVVCPWHSTSFS